MLYMARQLCCRGMCKNLWRSRGQQMELQQGEVSIEFELRAKIVIETDP